MTRRAPGTGRPRLLPGILAASALVVATAVGALAVTDRPRPTSATNCGSDRQWVTVRPVVILDSGWQTTELATVDPAVAGCLDTRHLPPTARQVVTDSRG